MVVRGADYERIDGDAYNTPISDIRAVLEMIEIGSTVLDPCRGRGNVVRAVKASGRKAVGLSVREAFLSEAPPFSGYDVFTNPPYGYGGRLAHRFIRRSLELVGCLSKHADRCARD
jgi:hypothetical protein